MQFRKLARALGGGVRTFRTMRRLRVGWSGAPRGGVRLGQVTVDRVSFAEALDAIESLVEAGTGGRIFTPNVDHLMLVEEHPRFKEAYQAATLKLADGMPLLWAARLLGRPLPEKISGSDLVLPLMRRAAQRGWGVYLLGGAPGVAAGAAAEFQRRLGVRIVGVDDGFLADPEDAAARAPLVARIRAARPDLVLVALGAPKQEVFIHLAQPDLPRVVFAGIGASLDFVTGRVRRAPAWMSRSGLEWLYRLGQEPRRLWRRYLVRDPKFARLIAGQLLERVRPRRHLQAGTPPLST